MRSAIVRKSDLNRVLDVLKERGIIPPVADVLPGGGVRLHLQAPANDDVDHEEEARKWDEALNPSGS